MEIWRLSFRVAIASRIVLNHWRSIMKADRPCSYPGIISTEVNNPSNTSPSCIIPLAHSSSVQDGGREKLISLPRGVRSFMEESYWYELNTEISTPQCEWIESAESTDWIKYCDKPIPVFLPVTCLRKNIHTRFD